MTPTSSIAPPLPAPAVAAGGAAPNACAVVINEEVRIPAGITDLASFRQWIHSDDFPEKLRVSYLDGVLWVDLRMVQALSHNRVKTEVAAVLRSLTKAANRGRYHGDGTQLSNPGAKLNTGPDGMYVSYTRFQSGQVQQVPNRHGVGAVEFRGTPVMVLEVVSDSSVDKDLNVLPTRYQIAGIPEFWRIDARGDLQFEILRLTPGGYVGTQLPDGWWRSDVFGRDFRMTHMPTHWGSPSLRWRRVERLTKPEARAEGLVFP